MINDLKLNVCDLMEIDVVIITLKQSKYEHRLKIPVNLGKLSIHELMLYVIFVLWCFIAAFQLFYNVVVNINACTNVEGETYSLSI